ncbi:MAG: type II secretion system protein GspM [Candidatus Binatia bacterium]
MKYDPRLLVNYYARLAPRERLLLGVAALSVVLISLYNFVWEPARTNGELTARRIVAKEKELAEIQHQREVYLDLLRRLEASQAAVSQGDENFSLFSYLDSTIAQAVGREHVTSMNPATKDIGTDYQEELVKIKLTQISLPQLVDLLYRVEKGDRPLRFSRLQIKKRFKDNFNFDVTATVSLLKAVHS